MLKPLVSIRSVTRPSSRRPARRKCSASVLLCQIVVRVVQSSSGISIGQQLNWDEISESLPVRRTLSKLEGHDLLKDHTCWGSACAPCNGIRLLTNSNERISIFVLGGVPQGHGVCSINPAREISSDRTGDSEFGGQDRANRTRSLVLQRGDRAEGRRPHCWVDP